MEKDFGYISIYYIPIMSYPYDGDIDGVLPIWIDGDPGSAHWEEKGG